MKKILVPVDLTEVSSNAITYARDCFPEAKLVILHIDSKSYSKENWQKQRAAFKDFVFKAIGTDRLPPNVNMEMLNGFVVNSVVEFSKKDNYDYLVMGTRDKYNLVDKIIGSSSLGIIKSTQIPTYLIPRHAKYHGMKNVMVASDKHMKEKSFVRIIRNWNKDYSANMQFLYVGNATDSEFTMIEDNIRHEFTSELQVDFDYSISCVNSTDISGSLLAVAYNDHADLMILLPDDQSFLGSLFSGSLSKEIIQKSIIPLMFIHPNNFVV